jgi:cell division septation protein DedD
VTTLQQSMPCVQPEFWQNYMDANQTQLFIGRLVPVYQKHFTADEMSGLLKFYRSPLGQKVINEMPTTMAEANQAGQQWSHERSDQMVNELKQMGTLDGSGRCPGKVAASPMGGTALEGAAAIQAAENGEKIKPRQATEGGEQSESKPAAKATSHSKAAPKKTTKPAPKKATPAKASAKPAAKTPAKAEAKPAPAKTDTKPAAATGGSTGQ